MAGTRDEDTIRVSKDRNTKRQSVERNRQIDMIGTCVAVVAPTISWYRLLLIECNKECVERRRFKGKMR